MYKPKNLVIEHEDLVVVSDFHGDIASLDQISGFLEEKVRQGYILINLGDNIDRFPNSREVLEWLKNIKKKYPGRIINLIGNHEWQYLGGPGCYPRTYEPTPDDIGFFETFYVAVFSPNFVFLHGGIPLECEIKRLDEGIITQIVWNDPARIKGVIPSPRTGFDPLAGIWVYGKEKMKEFLERVRKKCIISGHIHRNENFYNLQITVCSSRLSQSRSFLLITNGKIERCWF